MSAGRDGTGRARGARPAVPAAPGRAPQQVQRPRAAPGRSRWGLGQPPPAAGRSRGLRRAPPDGAGAAEVGREGGEKRARLGESRSEPCCCTEASGSGEPDVTVGSAQPQVLALSALVLPAPGLGPGAFFRLVCSVLAAGSSSEPDGSALRRRFLCASRTWCGRGWLAASGGRRHQARLWVCVSCSPVINAGVRCGGVAQVKLL